MYVVIAKKSSHWSTGEGQDIRYNLFLSHYPSEKMGKQAIIQSSLFKFVIKTKSAKTCQCSDKQWRIFNMTVPART